VLLSAAAGGVLLLALGLGWANGSNDVSKGIATLVGSGVSNPRAAASWAAVWTAAGGLAAAFISQGLVATFSGKEFLAVPAGGNAFSGAVAAGAVAWVVFASGTGRPVSTTHAIAGSLAGAGIAAQGLRSLHWSFFLGKVALPLALSPFLSLALLYVAFPALKSALSRVERSCVCLERGLLAPEGISALGTVGAAVVSTEESCAVSPAVVWRGNLLDGLHWLSAAMTSFARGLNDTPKIVALGIAASALLGVPGFAFYAAMASAIGLGSLLSGLRVTETLACRVTAMSPAEGFSANLVTTVLVGAASLGSFPVSTTHVSSGAVIGIGIRRGAASVRWGTVRDMAAAWLVTLPAAALIGGAAYAALR
jgi:PiT family inorganic phosphate transporter